MRITIIILLLFGLITAIIASSKGRDFLSWWIYGTLLFPFALIHAALLRGTIESIEEIQRRRGLIKCPHCAEMIKPDAKLCRYCGREIDIIDV